MATRTTTIRLPDQVRDRLDRYLAHSRLSLNQLVAKAITEYLDWHEGARHDCLDMHERARNEYMDRHDRAQNGKRGVLEMGEIDIALMAEILQKEGRDE